MPQPTDVSRNVRSVFLIAGLAALLLGGCTSSPPPAADTILINGKIVTLDEQSRVAEAMTMRDGRIYGVGSAAEMRQFVDAKTNVIDLNGRTVIPGLIDSHIHALRGGYTHALEADWAGARTIAEAMQRLAATAKTTPPDQWIMVSGGWTEQQFAEQRRPTQAEIVAAAPGRLVYVQLSYRAALLSPEGFKRLGITRDGHIPPKGHLERDSAGRPNGWIAGDLTTIVALFDRLPRPNLAQATDGTRAFFRELNRFGLTGVIDPGGHNLRVADYDVLHALQRDGDLTLRVAYSLFAPRAGYELEDFQAIIRSKSGGRTADGLITFNGIGECVTWGMYNNDRPTPQQKEDYYKVALWAAQQGHMLTQHWPSNASVHHLLDVFERVNREVPLAPLRWSIAHLHDATPETLTRMKALGVGWLMQDGLYYAAPAYLNARSRDTIARIPPIVSALNMGLPVGGGTDANRVMNYNPFVSLQWMLDGRTVNGTPTRDAREIPTREQALRLYTQGSAWFTRDEQTRGVLVPGAHADLAVLSQDFFAVPVSEIGRTTSLLTMVGGRIVYDAR